MSKKPPKLKALQESAKKNKKLYQYERPNPKILETFPNPNELLNKSVEKATLVVFGPEVFSMMIRISVPEFTSLCPLTGQPDFAEIVIEYRPRSKCIESKSLKLYLLGYRQFGEFHENCVCRILQDLVGACAPLYMRVLGIFTPRGGIPFHPCAEFFSPDWDEKERRIRTFTKETRVDGKSIVQPGCRLSFVTESVFGRTPSKPKTLKLNKKEFLKP